MKVSAAVVVVYAAALGLAMPHARSSMARASDAPQVQMKRISDLWSKEPTYKSDINDVEFAIQQMEQDSYQHEYYDDTLDRPSLRRMDMGSLFGDMTALWGF